MTDSAIVYRILGFVHRVIQVSPFNSYSNLNQSTHHLVTRLSGPAHPVPAHHARVLSESPVDLVLSSLINLALVRPMDNRESNSADSPT